MKLAVSNRQILSAAVIVFYLIPLLFFSIYSIRLMSQNKSWTLLTLGLLLVFIGSLSLILLISYWEQSVRDQNLISPLILQEKQHSLANSNQEAKVTQLDPSLTFEPPPLQEKIKKKEGSEEDKELNLLQAALEGSEREYEELKKELEKKDNEFLNLKREVEVHQTKALKIEQDFADYKLFSEEQLKQKQMQLTSLQQLIEDQRNEMEKRQDQIHQLDTKVHDLSYEIKTLLYLHQEESLPAKSSTPPTARGQKFSLRTPDLWDNPEPSPEEENLDTLQQSSNESDGSAVQSAGEAIQLMRKCIQIAQKLTGTNYHGNESSRYRTFTTSYFAIDQRRLFDSLREEKGALIIVYSPKESKVLFANNSCKTLLGWGPEKFLTDFPLIMQEGMQEWRKALHLLKNTPESQARLLAKTKQGQELIMNCHLGTIPGGLFRSYIIGILYPA